MARQPAPSQPAAAVAAGRKGTAGGRQQAAAAAHPQAPSTRVRSPHTAPAAAAVFEASAGRRAGVSAASRTMETMQAPPLLPHQVRWDAGNVHDAAPVIFLLELLQFPRAQVGELRGLALPRPWLLPLADLLLCVAHGCVGRRRTDRRAALLAYACATAGASSGARHAGRAGRLPWQPCLVRCSSHRPRHSILQVCNS